jgi:endonuclease/exonuclease/phosphatase family metal-dependent hydrolase
MIVFLGGCTKDPPHPDAIRAKVVTQNLGDVITPRPTVGEIAEVFGEMPRADVYLLQEVAGSRAASAIAEALSAGNSEYRSLYTSRAGVSVVTRLPILSWSAAPGASALQAHLAVGEHATMRVVSVHLPAFGKPRQRDGDARIGPIYGMLRLARETVTPNGRSRSLDRILTWLKEEQGREGQSPAVPTVVGGDFNTVPLTLAPRKMRKDFRDSLRGSGDFWTGTYQRIAGPLSARVDFLFHSHAMHVLDAFVHGKSAGDHLPVYAEYALPLASTSR